MKIKTKIFIYSLILLLISLGFIYFFANFYLTDTFTELEKSYINERITRVENAMKNDLEKLKSLTLDWAIWDDTRNYILNDDLEYIESNMGVTTYINTELNFIAITDLDKNILFSEGYDLTTKKRIKFDNEIIDYIENRDNDSKFIYLKDNGKIVSIAYSKVYDSNKSTEPVGYLIMGYFNNEEKLKKLEKRVDVEFSVGLSDENKENTQYYYKKELNNIFSKKVIGKISNNLYLHTVIKTNRWLYNLLKKLLEQSIYFLIIIFLFVYWGFKYILDKSIISRVENLKKELIDITETYNHGKRVTEIGKDELGVLGIRINDMLEKMKKMNQEISLSKEKYKSLYEETAALHFIIDDKYRIKNTNKAVQRLLRYSRKELKNKKILDLLNEDDIPKVIELVKYRSIKGNEDRFELCFIGGDGDEHIVSVSPTDLKFLGSGRYSILLTGTDITDQKRLEEKLHKLATIDEMTGAYNRRAGFEMINKVIEKLEMEDQNDGKFAICYIDINDLKSVNDKYGHNKGDEMILVVMEILKDITREEDSIVRLGGDEFLMILPNCTKKTARSVWNRIEDKLDDINDLKSFEFPISVSHGYAFYEKGNSKSVDRLIEIADNRMYEEKKRKKNN